MALEHNVGVTLTGKRKFRTYSQSTKLFVENPAHGTIFLQNPRLGDKKPCSFSIKFVIKYYKFIKFNIVFFYNFHPFYNLKCQYRVFSSFLELYQAFDYKLAIRTYCKRPTSGQNGCRGRGEDGYQLM